MTRQEFEEKYPEALITTDYFGYMPGTVRVELISPCIHVDFLFNPASLCYEDWGIVELALAIKARTYTKSDLFKRLETAFENA